MSSTLVILFDFCWLGRKEVTLISEDVKPRRAPGATTDRGVGDHERRTWCDEGADVGKKIRRDRGAIRQIFEIRRAPTNARRGNPIAPAARVN
jgi:hypothetical protein